MAQTHPVRKVLSPPLNMATRCLEQGDLEAAKRWLTKVPFAPRRLKCKADLPVRSRKTALALGAIGLEARMAIPEIENLDRNADHVECIAAQEASAEVRN